LGFFSYDNNTGNIRIAWPLFLCQILMAAIVGMIVMYNSYQFIAYINQFIDQAKTDSGILSSWNLGILYFKFLNLMLCLSYLIWLITDLKHLRKAGKPKFLA
jgi:hypothetical protein